MTCLLDPVDTARVEPADLSHAIISPFLAACAAKPDAIALRSVEGEMSYAELDAQSSAMAQALVAGGELNVDQPVAILAERSPWLIAAMIACVKEGVAFVSLDTAYPDARLAQLVRIANPQRVLCRTPRPAVTDEHAAPVLILPLDPAHSRAGRASFPCQGRASQVAYLLFTTGTTGAPKCIAVGHAPLRQFVEWQAKTFGLTAADRFTMISGLSHDPVLRDIFTPLSLGASIEIPPPDALVTPGGLPAWLSQCGASVIHLTPAHGQLITAAGAQLPALRHAFFGGDRLPLALARRFQAYAPHAALVNFYGATETPQAIAYWPVNFDVAELHAPIGRAVAGFRLELDRVDEKGHGEIIVSSPHLSLGEVRTGLLSALSPLATDGTYRTGDIGRRDAAGDFVIVGRRDDQVKIRGYRVALNEISAEIDRELGTTGTLSLNIGTDDAPRLWSFVVGSPEGLRRSAADLIAALNARLPDYMVPLGVTFAEAAPLLPNGKVDRAAVRALIERDRPAPPLTPAPDASDVSPHAEALLDQWRDILNDPRLTIDSSFAAAGGDSLSYVNAYFALEDLLGRAPEGWEAMTIRELVAAKDPANAKSGAKLGANIETVIALRAGALLMVVASHVYGWTSDGGVTDALFWIGGGIFARLQMKQAAQDGRLTPLWRFIGNILIPLGIFSAVNVCVFAWRDHVILWPALFGLNDLVDYGNDAALLTLMAKKTWGLWYIHALVHMVLFNIIGIYLAQRLMKKPADGVRLAAISLFILGAISTLILPLAFGLNPWLGKIPGTSIFRYLPTSNLATFEIGALFAMATGRARWVWVAISILFAALEAPGYGVSIVLAMAFIAILSALAPSLSSPKWLYRIIYEISGASLFIYLLHFVPIRIAPKLMGAFADSQIGQGLMLVAGVLFGYGVWRGWKAAHGLLSKAWARAARAQWTRSLRASLGAGFKRPIVAEPAN